MQYAYILLLLLLCSMHTTIVLYTGIHSSGGKFGGFVTLAVVRFRTFTLAVVLSKMLYIYDTS